MGVPKVLLIAPDATSRAALASDLSLSLAVDAATGMIPALPRVAAGEYDGAVCVVETPEDLAAVVRIRKASPALAVVALLKDASAALVQLARQMGAVPVVDRKDERELTVTLIRTALETRGLAAQAVQASASIRRTSDQIRELTARSRDLVARAMGVLASCNDRPFVVMHVDDDEFEEVFFRRLLIRAGLPSFVRSFRSAEAALRYLTGEGEYADRVQHPLPSLVISDLNLGTGMDGLDLLGWIRRRVELQSIGFVLVTSSDREDDLRRAAESGANLYVVKSIRMDCVVEVLNATYASWLNLHPANRIP